MQHDLSLFEPFQRALGVGKSVWTNDWEPSRYAFAPGRVEVLGNHVDYNGGPVLAAAIDRFTTVLAQPGETAAGRLEVVLADVDRAHSIAIEIERLGDWRNETGSQVSADYLRGAVASLRIRGKSVDSGRFAVASSVPMGIGVSSSAALCVALILALSSDPLEYEDLVLTAQEAEHRAGTPCGTMDQSASISGGMIRFDGSNHRATRLNPDLQGYAFLVVDSGVRRSLISSSYPRRVEECREALAKFDQLTARHHANLASVTPGELDSIEHALEPVLLKRARHVVSEVRRVHEGEAALIAGDWKRFGELMAESGRSSAQDYEISHETVEELVGRLLETPGVLGARMMGGGEGGSLIALIEPDESGDILRRVEAIANADLGRENTLRTVYRFSFAQGATRGDVGELLARR